MQCFRPLSSSRSSTTLPTTCVRLHCCFAVFSQCNSFFFLCVCVLRPYHVSRVINAVGNGRLMLCLFLECYFLLMCLFFFLNFIGLEALPSDGSRRGYLPEAPQLAMQGQSARRALSPAGSRQADGGCAGLCSPLRQPQGMALGSSR